MDLACIVLTRNEAEVISGCIESLSSLKPEEILVIDDGSTDNTVKIARQKGARVITHIKRDFAEARNFSQKQVSSSWILYIDADERLSPSLVDEIKLELHKSNLVFAAFVIPRINYFLGKRWPHQEKIIRLIKKSALINWYGPIHESPQINGQIGYLNHPIWHHTHRNLAEMVNNTIVWSEIEAKLRLATGHPPVSWWRIFRVMFTAFFEYYLKQGGWKIGTVGLIESLYQAFSIFITYARLWELQRNKIRG